MKLQKRHAYNPHMVSPTGTSCIAYTTSSIRPNRNKYNSFQFHSSIDYKKKVSIQFELWKAFRRIRFAIRPSSTAHTSNRSNKNCLHNIPTLRFFVVVQNLKLHKYCAHTKCIYSMNIESPIIVLYNIWTGNYEKSVWPQIARVK